ncbi:MAG: DeoR/GlpR transcriptional regulator [Lawsonibacter sp.]|jgi:DeoR/GlpR family transcriptional regulator of sugar metabolism|uniref:DeoR/GlpR family DNA-binding transcription regulator n=1 Tax=Lawsonibacter sp. JLR.KK007 TaxID=3114293 RepID=UPI002172FB25|nr:DeoR/GlpR transcriptional regulator [Lawsonibacter sp.]
MKQDRETMILELLTAEHRLEVSALAGRVGVSQVTMRKDLDDLERRGLVIREHGCALLRSSDDVQSRIAYHYEAKRKIAERAAELVDNGDTIMIESGSCCALLADVLVQRRKDLTILTNSAFIASYIRGKGAVQTILLGGIYQPEAQVMVGPMVRLCAEGFFVSRFFIGVDGWSARTGFTNQDHMRAQAVRDMAGQAERVVVLTESEKFTRRGVVPLNLPQREGQIVVTSRTVSEEVLTALKEQGIEVCLTD